MKLEVSMAYEFRDADRRFLRSNDQLINRNSKCISTANVVQRLDGSLVTLSQNSKEKNAEKRQNSCSSSINQQLDETSNEDSISIKKDRVFINSFKFWPKKSYYCYIFNKTDNQKNVIDLNNNNDISGKHDDLEFEDCFGDNDCNSSHDDVEGIKTSNFSSYKEANL